MIKRFSVNKLIKVLVIFLVAFLVYLFPNKEDYNLNTKMVLNESKHHDIFLLDNNNLISKTSISILSENNDDLIKELLESLIINGKYSNKIPNNFYPTIPENTKLLSYKLNDNIITINFNKNLYDIEEKKEEGMIESIIFTLTSIDGIKGVKILVEGNIYNKLKNNKIISDVLTRDFGINKEYNINDIKDITSVTIYYTNKTNNEIYYIPVTKYMNRYDDKIKIIINELTSRISYNSNLISYLNSNTKLLDYSFNENELSLNFNEYIFDNKKDDKILEEVIYSISYSIEDTLNVSNIKFFVNNKEIKNKY